MVGELAENHKWQRSETDGRRAHHPATGNAPARPTLQVAKRHRRRPRCLKVSPDYATKMDLEGT
jgi:hypothetical protein